MYGADVDAGQPQFVGELQLETGGSQIGSQGAIADALRPPLGTQGRDGALRLRRLAAWRARAFV